MTGESIESVIDTLNRSQLREQLATDVEAGSIVSLCESLTLDVDQDDARGCLSNAARCAVETSVLDAVLKAADLPLAKVTELVPEAFGVRATNDVIYYTAPITSMSPWKQT